MSLSVTINIPVVIPHLKQHIYGKEGSLIKLINSCTGANIKIDRQNITVEAETQENLNNAILVIMHVVNNSIVVFTHPSMIETYIDADPRQKFNFVPFKERLCRMRYRLRKVQGLGPHIVISREPNPNINMYSVENLKNKITAPRGYETCVELGYVTYYNAHNQRYLDNKIYTPQMFMYYDVGYGKDFKASWMPQLVKGDYNAVLKLFNNYSEASKITYIQVHLIDTRGRRRIVLNLDLEGNITRAYTDYDINYVANIAMLSIRPDIRIVVSKKHESDESFNHVINYSDGRVNILDNNFILDHYKVMNETTYISQDRILIATEYDDNRYGREHSIKFYTNGDVLGLFQEVKNVIYG